MCSQVQAPEYLQRADLVLMEMTMEVMIFFQDDVLEDQDRRKLQYEGLVQEHVVVEELVEELVKLLRLRPQSARLATMAAATVRM